MAYSIEKIRLGSNKEGGKTDIVVVDNARTFNGRIHLQDYKRKDSFGPTLTFKNIARASPEFVENYCYSKTNI